MHEALVVVMEVLGALPTLEGRWVLFRLLCPAVDPPVGLVSVQ